LSVGRREIPEHMSELMQRALHTVEKWCDEGGLSVNPDKTDLVVFTKKRKLDDFFQPLLFGAICTVLSRSGIWG
jgi:hypothetical protein